MTRSKTLLLACLAFAPAMALAQMHVYQWTDANGVRHYSQTPPPKGTADERSIKTAEGKAAAPSAAAPTQTGEQQACTQARANSVTLESQQNVAVEGKNGDSAPRVMSADERAEAKSRTQKEIDLYCNRK